MKRNHATKLLIVMSFIVLSVAAANSVVAFPDSASECGNIGCHETRGTLTLTTNSTVDAETGIPFVLQIDAGSGAHYIAVKSGWADNSFFTISEPLIEDDSTNDTNASTGEISVEITFTPLTNGTYTIRIWTVGPAASDLAESFDVTVTVTGETGTTPTPTADLYEIWSMMMIVVPIATGLILVVFGYLALRRK
ncbi:MAG: hypothetical protein ACFFCX_16895 [Candidatus Sifarchaeia archaeon]